MDVLVLGSVNVDTILSVAALPGPGETVLADGLVRLPGGKGANQAVAAIRMGAHVAMAGAVGDDGDGRWMRDILAREGIDIAAIAAVPGRPTGAAMIAVDRAGENQIIVAAGANADFTPAMLPPVGNEVVLAQLEIPVATIAAAFAAACGPRILNAAPSVAAAAELFALTDILIVNQHELADYLGCAPVADVAAALTARALLTRPDQAVVVTLGAGGAVAIWPEHHVHAPAIRVEPVDTVGAGDCFCGALAALIAEGHSIAEALPLANAAAALCTQATGAVPAMPVRAAAEAMLAQRPTEYA